MYLILSFQASPALIWDSSPDNSIQDAFVAGYFDGPLAFHVKYINNIHTLSSYQTSDYC